MQRQLSIYVNNQFYKTIMVDATDNYGYDPRPILLELAADHDAGLFAAFITDGAEPVYRIQRMHSH